MDKKDGPKRLCFYALKALRQTDCPQTYASNRRDNALLNAANGLS
jgi:hypothetical protein